MLWVCVKNSVYVLKATASMLAVQLLRSAPSGQEGEALPELPEERPVTSSSTRTTTSHGGNHPCTASKVHFTSKNVPQNPRASKLKANHLGSRFRFRGLLQLKPRPSSPARCDVTVTWAPQEELNTFYTFRERIEGHVTRWQQKAHQGVCRGALAPRDGLPAQVTHGEAQRDSALAL